MLNRNSSAGTAAKKWFKCSLLQRQAPLAAMLLLAAVYSSCNENTEQKQGVDVKSKYTSWTCDIKVVDIDSCEYIVAQTGFRDGGLSIVHKQNCKYCATRSLLK